MYLLPTSQHPPIYLDGFPSHHPAQNHLALSLHFGAIRLCWKPYATEAAKKRKQRGEPMNERIYYSREAELRAQRDRFIMAVIVTGFGIGVGAILALLLAPRSGDETRQQIGGSIDDAAGHGREVASQVLKTVRQGATKVQEQVGERLQQVVNQ
jgi:hypothetical protein